MSLQHRAFEAEVTWRLLRCVCVNSGGQGGRGFWFLKRLWIAIFSVLWTPQSSSLVKKVSTTQYPFRAKASTSRSPKERPGFVVTDFRRGRSGTPQNNLVKGSFWD